MSYLKDGNQKLKLTKIFWGSAKSQYAQITLTENYGGQNMGTLAKMVEVAQKDFPELKLNFDKVSATVLGGDRRKGMWGIEFEISGRGNKKMPKEYTNTQPEPRLA